MTGQGTSLKLRSRIRPGAVNPLLPKFKAAVAAARAGGTPARMMALGHSYVAGAGSGGNEGGGLPHGVLNCVPTGYAAKIGFYLGLSGLPTLNNSFFGDQNPPIGVPAGGADYRITVGTGWSVDPSQGYLGDHVFTQAANGVGFLDFTPGFAFSSIKIWAPAFSGLSTSVGVYADGVLIGTFNQGTGGNTYRNTTFTVPDGTLKISLKNNHASLGAYINAVECFPATLPVATMAICGWMGALSSNFDLNALPWQTPSAVTAYAPHLLIIDTMLNDLYALFSAASWKTNTQTFLSAAGTSFDPVIVADPIAFGIDTGLRDQYITAANELVAANGGIVLDMTIPMLNTFAAGNALGYWYPDVTHPSLIGHDNRMAPYSASQVYN